MKGRIYNLGTKFSIIFLIIAEMVYQPVLANNDVILIVKSNENTFFNATIENLINHTSQKLKFSITTLENFDQHSQVDKPRAIITLGQKAALIKQQVQPDIPIIESYITKIQLEHSPQTRKRYSLLLNQPLSRYIQFTKLLLATEKIGLLNSIKNKFESSQLKQLSREWDVEINQRVLSDQQNPVSHVRKLLQENDVLLSLPDPGIYNQQTLKGILLSSYRLGKPLISYSPAHVKSGALAAIYTSPEQIGKQLAELLQKLLNSRRNDQQTFYANDFKIITNQQVANSLDLDIPAAAIIEQQLRGDLK